MMILGLAAFLVQSAWDDPPPTGRWAADTSQLASELLPPNMAADAVTHVVGLPTIKGGPPFDVRFLGRPVPIGDGFCARRTYYVSIRSEPGGNDGKAQVPVVGQQVRLGGCEGIFAQVNPRISLGEAKRILRWLEWAQATARTEAPLPFGLACRSEPVADTCAGGARAVLASLRFTDVTLINAGWPRPQHRWEVTVEDPASRFHWRIGIDASPGRESVDLAWRVPAPF